MEKSINAILISNNENDPLFQNIIGWSNFITNELVNINGGTLYLSNISEESNLIEKHKLTNFPALIFFDESTGLSLAHLQGSEVNQSNFNKMIFALDDFEGGTGNEFIENADGEIIGSEVVLSVLPSGEPGFFGLGGLSFNLPNFFWYLKAGLCGLMFVRAKTKTGKIVWGSGTVYAGYNIIKNRKYVVMDNKKIIGFSLIGFVVYYLMGGKSKSKKRKYYLLPDGTRAEESELPDLGYMKFQGKWINQFAIENLYNQSSISNQGFSFQEFQNNLDTIFGSVFLLENYYQQFFPASNPSDLLLGEPSGDYSDFA